jgi:glycerate dehydrogenase
MQATSSPPSVSPKIVVLDGFTLNPGDLSWDKLKELGECVVHDRTSPAQVLARAAGAEIVLTNKTVLTADHLGHLPKLRYVGVLATGYNVVGLEAARARGIVVTNVPAYGTASVVQLTFALLLELALHVGHHARTVREGRWSRSADFAYWDHPLLELAGLTMGLIGFGRIGQAVARVARAFDMAVLVHTPRPPDHSPVPVEFVDLETVFRRSDVVSLHCPLTPATKGLVDRERLALMKPTAWLLNTGRGPLVDEVALAEALNTGRLGGAGLDVLAVEPPPADHPLLAARNCVITPHVGWATRAARARLMAAAVANVKAFLRGQPINRVA